MTEQNSIGKRFHRFLLQLSLLSTTMLFLYSCDSAPSSREGKLEVWLHDAPTDLDEVQIYVERVEIGKQGEGWVILGEPKKHFDLLRLTNGNYEILGADLLEPGRYHQLRLIVSGQESYVVEGGEERTLFIPSGEQTGVKLPIDIEITEDSHYVLLLDFDAERSLVRPGSGGQPADFLLKPVIRTTHLAEAGHISGVVSPAGSRAVVYAISGQDTLSTTYADLESGEFVLFGLKEGVVQVSVQPREEAYRESLLDDVTVKPGETTDLGLIELEEK